LSILLEATCKRIAAGDDATPRANAPRRPVEHDASFSSSSMEAANIHFIPVNSEALHMVSKNVVVTVSKNSLFLILDVVPVVAVGSSRSNSGSNSSSNSGSNSSSNSGSNSSSNSGSNSSSNSSSSSLVVVVIVRGGGGERVRVAQQNQNEQQKSRLRQ